MKNITITVCTCNECPYMHHESDYPGTHCSNPDVVKGQYIGLSYGEPDYEIEIPDWCPLDDA